MKSKCHKCHRSSSQTDGWWTVYELQRQYDLCPSCYRNKSLLAYRETLFEIIENLDVNDSDPSVLIGMQIMKLRCKAIVRDTPFND